MKIIHIQIAISVAIVAVMIFFVTAADVVTVTIPTKKKIHKQAIGQLVGTLIKNKYLLHEKNESSCMTFKKDRKYKVCIQEYAAIIKEVFPYNSIEYDGRGIKPVTRESQEQSTHTLELARLIEKTLYDRGLETQSILFSM